MKLSYFLTIPLIFCSIFVQSQQREDRLIISTQTSDGSSTLSKISQFLNQSDLMLGVMLYQELPALPKGRYFRVDEHVGIIKFINRFFSEVDGSCAETFFLEVASADDKDQVGYLQLQVTKNSDGEVLMYEIKRTAKVWKLSELPFFA